jgi:putative ABC transport system permease protein
MNVVKFAKFRLILSFVVLIVLIIVSNYLNFMVNNSVLNVIEYKNIDNKEGITFDEFSKVKNNYKDIDFTSYSEIKSDVTNKYGVSPNKYGSAEDKMIKTKVVLTDEKYFDFYPFYLITGGKLDFLSVKRGDRVVVISDVLANALFKCNNIIGSTLKINNENYRIIGVYKENKSLTYRMAEDGYERVYIPYTSYKSENKESNLFLDTLTTRQTKKYDEKNINDKLTKVLGDKLSVYKIVDYTVSKQLVFQNIKILYFIIGIFIIIYLIKVMIKHIKETVSFFIEKMKSNYIKEALLNNKRGFIVRFSKILICALLIVVIFNLVKFNVVIVKKYLPPENIFDISFYKEAVVSNIQLNNANEAGFSNVYDRYLNTIRNIESIIFLVELVISINIIMDYKDQLVKVNI